MFKNVSKCHFGKTGCLDHYNGRMVYFQDSKDSWHDVYWDARREGGVWEEGRSKARRQEEDMRKVRVGKEETLGERRQKGKENSWGC